MTAMPLEEHSLYEREQLARINATPAAPESFDPIAALRRVEAVAESWEGKADAARIVSRASDNDYGRGYMKGFSVAYDRAVDDLRTTLATQAGWQQWDDLNRDDGPQRAGLTRNPITRPREQAGPRTQRQHEEKRDA